MQAVGLHGIQEEQDIIVREKSEAGYFSRLAAAVTLSSGGVLLTGGRHWEHKVFLLYGSGLSRWEERASMIAGRLGHAAIKLPLREESVMVAGGWDVGGQAQAGVELYSLAEDKWKMVKPLPSPRADFALQVTTHTTGNPQTMLQVIDHHIMAVGGYSIAPNHEKRQYPEVAVFSWGGKEGLGEWREVGQMEGRRTGFMAVPVSRAWLNQLCIWR